MKKTCALMMAGMLLVGCNQSDDKSPIEAQSQTEKQVEQKVKEYVGDWYREQKNSEGKTTEIIYYSFSEDGKGLMQVDDGGCLEQQTNFEYKVADNSSIIANARGIQFTIKVQNNSTISIAYTDESGNPFKELFYKDTGKLAKTAKCPAEYE